MLNEKQKLFCKEYLVDLNATRAAERAGYSSKTAFLTGHRLLRNDNVQAEIKRLQGEIGSRFAVTPERVLLELWRLATVDIGEVLNFEGDTLLLHTPSKIPENARRAIQSVKVKRAIEGKGEETKEVELIEFRLADKRGSLELLGKHLGMFSDKIKIEMENQIDLSKMSEDDRDRILTAMDQLRAAKAE